jgi:serine/threonine-protein kinase RsbW
LIDPSEFVVRPPTTAALLRFGAPLHPWALGWPPALTGLRRRDSKPEANPSGKGGGGAKNPGRDYFTPSQHFRAKKRRSRELQTERYRAKRDRLRLRIRSIIAIDLGMKTLGNDGLLELRLPSAPRLLHIVRSVVGQAAALRGFSEEETQFIILAVDEACSNVIRHAYQGREDGEIVISCTERPDGIEFLLTDFGKAADAACWPKRSLDEVRPGGLGLALIQAVMDRVEYRRGDGCNELLLAKALNSTPVLARQS